MATNNLNMVFEPQKILELSQTLATRHQNVTERVEAYAKTALSLAGSWQGDAADQYVLVAGKLKDRGLLLAKRLEGMSQMLREVSGIYQRGEAQAVQQTEALPVDGVFK